MKECIEFKDVGICLIDIKYSTFYDSINKKWNYSALIMFKDKVDE